MSRLISLAVLIGIIIVIGLLFYRVLIGFFVPVFLASVLVVVFRPVHDWVLSRTGHRDSLAATLTTLLIMLALFLPVTVVFVSAAVQGLKLVEQNDAATVMLRINKVRDSLGLQMPRYKEQLRLVEGQLTRIVDATEEARDRVDIEAALAQLEQLGGQLAVSLQELKDEVGTQLGPRWDASFEELIALSTLLGAAPDPEEPLNEAGMAKLAVDLRTGFAKLKTNLLGGSFMAVARQAANPTDEDVEAFTRQALDFVQPRLLSITGATGGFIIRLAFGSVILIVATFFFLYDGPSMIKAIMHLSPLDDAYERELLMEFESISRAVVVATLLAAIAQGVTAGVGYFFAGMDFLVLLVMLTTVFAMVPFIGPGVVWIPVCLYIGIYEERYLAAAGLAVWGMVAVGTVDNIVKAVVLHGQSQLHPLLALLSVLGGVQTLGPIGIVVGPMVVAMLQTLLSILQRELVRLEGQDFSLGNRQSLARARFKSRDAAESDSEDEAEPESNNDDHGDDAPNDKVDGKTMVKNVTTTDEATANTGNNRTRPQGSGYVPPTRKAARKGRRK